MTMIRIAIVEDSALDREKVLDCLKRYRGEYGTEMSVVSFQDGALLLENYKNGYDIIFMDIKMPLTDGMTTAGEIRRADPEVVIIFITNMPQYAIRGYAVEALDYILKPLHYFAFSQCLNRAISRMNNRAAKYITITINRGLKKINTADIYYVESRNHNLIFHTSGGALKTLGTLRGIEEKLAELYFARGNNWYLINLRHVESVQDGYALVCGERLFLSRSRKGAFMDSLTKYLEGSLK
jgi:DNA-binding LytR/AlgR family response regulator